MSSLARAWVRWSNAAARQLRRIAPSSPLEVGGLLQAARRSTGLDDFGSESFREPLARLVHALETEAELTPLGRTVASARLRTHLVNRLRLVQDAREEPAIVQQRITRPLFIVGAPRTGTSILFRTLAQDEGALSPLAWKLQFPSPPPERDARRIDRRFVQVRGHEIFIHAVIPDLRRVYQTKAELPEECVVLKAHEFTTIMFSMAYSVPSYEKWLLDCDHGTAYAWHQRILQQLQWRAGDGHWILKSPEHLLSLDALFARYPDARIVWTHRDPLEIVASVASLIRVLRSLSTEAIDEARIGREAAWFWAAALERGRTWRAAHPELEDRFIDVRFDELCADPLAVVRRIYASTGMNLAPETETRLQGFLARNPRGRHGEHRYSLDAFGLDPREVAERFAEYRDAYGYSEGGVA